ncbi:carbohydrate porin [Klebsiella pneumoniae]|uniref:carbohydrate porin n=1 Tax=Klebsiella pneumoniae TaxID=573 RepID=UPI001ABC275B|nr:carbohydrate porin [Klebsiella pneumoniae]MBO3721286.1 carbohydrate porin [Klebsiella pneumoniae]HCM5830592.1 carbohydrate porin [Klebsiella pneumoniae]
MSSVLLYKFNKKKLAISVFLMISFFSPLSNAKDDCQSLNYYNTRAQQVTSPSSICDTILQDAGSFRSALAENGWGFQASFSPNAIYDLKGHSYHPQQYSGQNFTWAESGSVILTYDLSRIGFSKDAQFTVIPQWQSSNYNDGTPRLHNIGILAINQPFNDRQYEVQYGFYPLIRMFYGMVLGGNSASAALGPTSVIPVQLGLSYLAPTPAFSFIARDDSKKFYSHTSVSRSISPQGFGEDVNQNPWGLKLRVKGANPIFVEELGYKQESTQDNNAWWIRVGGIYNKSHYQSFVNSNETDDNFGWYFANTVQLTQSTQGTPKGLYLDTKTSGAKDDRNPYANDFQMTMFDIGLFPGRDTDMISLGYTRSWTSSKFRSFIGNETQQKVPNVINAVSLSYAYHVIPGIYLINGLTWQDNPTLVPEHNDAMLWQTSVNITF